MIYLPSRTWPRVMLKHKSPDPTLAYLDHKKVYPLNKRKISTLKKEFLDALKVKFKLCYFDVHTTKNFGWVTEDGDEFLISFWYTARRSSSEIWWKEMNSLGALYSNEGLVSHNKKYNAFLKWLYEELFYGKIPYLPN